MRVLVAVTLLLLVPANRAEAVEQCGGRAVTVFLARGDRPAAGDDVIAGTPDRDVIDAGAGYDLVCGRGGDDVIRLGNGSDEAYGGAGDDLLAGGRGADRMEGGAGRDRYRGGPGWDVCELDRSTDDCESLYIID